jgi:putative ABC transport system permease protein
MVSGRHDRGTYRTRILITCSPHREAATSEFGYALRRLRMAWGFTLFAVVTLALGIGATTALYSVAHAALFREPAIRDFDRVVNLYHSDARGPLHHMAFSWPDVIDIRASQTVFSDMMAWSFFQEGLSGPAGFELVRGEMVSGDYFDFAGARPLMGRALRLEDDDAASASVAVISQGYWQRRFGGEPAVLGRTLTLKGRPFEIVGVMPAAFRGMDIPNAAPTAIWVPIGAAALMGERRPQATWSDRDHRWVLLKGRLASGHTLDSARAQMTAIAERLDRTEPLREHGRAHPSSPAASRRFSVSMASDVRLHESVDWLAMPLAQGSLIAVGLTLLVACTTLANLLIARGARQRHEVAVRRALGASRWRLLSPLALESCIVGLAGGAAGVLTAAGLLRMLAEGFTMGRSVTVILEPRLEPPVLAVALAATLGSLAVFGLIPAWHNTNVSMRQVLDTAGGGVVPRWRARRVLIGVQVAVSVALLAVGAVFARAALTTARHDPGFDLNRLLAAHVVFAYDPRPADHQPRSLAAVLEAVQRRPGVESAALASGLPVHFGGGEGAYVGREPQIVATMARAELGQYVLALRGTSDLFRTLGVRLVDGRGFTEGEVAAGARVVVIARSVARRAFGTPLASGRTLFVGPDSYTVVGVADEVDAGTLGTRDRGFIYLPWRFDDARSVVITARADRDPATLAEDFRRTLREVDPDLPVVESTTGPEIATRQTLFNRVAADLTVALGGFTLVLALVGLSGLLAYLVSSRRREIGVRMALGATSARIVRLVLEDGLRPVLVGSLVGLVAGALTSHALASLFLPRAGLDTASVLLVPLVLLPAAMLACYLPARRAARVDPSVALRDA